MKKIIVIVLIIGMFIGSAILLNKWVQNTATGDGIKTDTELSLWTVYWDTKDLATELEQRQHSIQNISFFAAYFDENDQLFIPEETIQSTQYVEGNYSQYQWPKYLTIVNDRKNGDGTSSLKDTQLLKERFANDEAMGEHVEEIIALALEDGYEGIELDYEAIRKDRDLWQQYMIFCKRLYEGASDKGLKLRILLEPSTPMEKLQFPEGPTYVIMCYNLHGYGTRPGPKADPKFLKSLVKKAKNLPGEKEFALATGGFSWNKSGKVSALTEREAYDLMVQSGAQGRRDRKSQCIFYQYEDSLGEKYEVWYADQVTLNHWISTLYKSGEKQIALWRIGGNRDLK